MGLGQGIRLGQVPQESRGYHGGGGGGLDIQKLVPPGRNDSCGLVLWSRLLG